MARKIALLFLAVLLVFESGCSMPYIYPVPSDKVRAPLGTIGVISSCSVPFFYYYTPDPEGKIEGTFKGAGRGMLSVLGWWWDLIHPLVLIVSVAALPFGAVAGSVHGAVTAVSEEDIEDAQKTLDMALNSLRIQQAMRDRFIIVTQTKTDRRIADINKMIFAADNAKPPLEEGELIELIKSKDLKEAGFDSVIIYDAAAIHLHASDKGRNPPLLFYIDAKVRILSADGMSLYATNVTCEGETHRFTRWAAKDCSLFKEALERCYDDIAKQAVERLFILKTKDPETK